MNAAELTVINLSERKNSFDKVFGEMEKDAESKFFFTGNISGLFDTVRDIKKISIEKKYVKNTLEEEIIFYK